MRAPNPDTEARLVAQIPGAHYVATVVADDGTTRDLPWVPYGPDFEIPLYGEYVGTGPFDWQLGFVVMDGRPQCVEFVANTIDPRRAITPESLHRFPLGQKLEEAVLMASRPADEVPRTFRRWESVEQVRAERAAVARELRKRPNGHGRWILTDDFLREVAEVYRQHVAGGKPSKAVQEHFHYKPESARRVVREARLRGFLGPARPGRGGEQPKEGEDDGK